MARKQRMVRIVAAVAIAAMLAVVVAALLRDDPAPEVSDDPAAAATDAEVDDASDESSQPDDDAEAAADGESEPCDVEPVDAPSDRDGAYDEPPEVDIDTSSAYVATVSTTCGDIELELAAADAPTTVSNFVFLAQEGYYADTPFHRVIDGFMIQGGDPTGTGGGGPGYAFDDELDLAEAEGYPRGTLAMANSGSDTNGSQFFIVHQDAGELPPDYTVFGEVTAGMDVVDRIALGPVEGDQATTPVAITSVTIDDDAA